MTERLISIVFMALIVYSRGVRLRTRVPGMRAWRSGIGVVSLGLWLYSIAYLPLATAMTLNDMSGVWVAAFVVGGAVLYGRNGAAQRQGPLLATVLAGFAGMLRPTPDT